MPRKRPVPATGAPMRLPASSARLGEGSALQRLGLVGLVIIAHAAGLALLVQFANRPVLIPELTTISLALIEAEPALTPEPPAPAPSVPPTPPQPKVEKLEPPPPKPQPAPEPITKPSPKPTPKPAPKPKLTQSASALSQTEPTPEPTPEPTVAPAPVAPAPAVAAAPVREAAPAALTAARFDAAYLNNPAPAYPMLSRRLREEGEVMLRVLVAADGQPKRIEVRTGSGSERLDRAAEDAVARWRFVPARRGDTAVEAWVLVPIVFKLKGN
ncbi:hypothetical protein MASR2M16_04290 [Thauera terpenica]